MSDILETASPVADPPLPPCKAEGEDFRITVVSKAYHSELLEAARKMGSILAMAEYLEVSSATLGKWINLKSFPTLVIHCDDGTDRSASSKLIKKWPEISRKLTELTGKTIKELFPAFVYLGGAPITSRQNAVETVHTVNAGDMLDWKKTQDALPPPEQQLGMEELREKLREQMSETLKSLTFREREVIKLRFGMEGHATYTYEEIGRIMEVSRERVRQIEIRALQKLRQTHRSSKLEPILEAMRES